MKMHLSLFALATAVSSTVSAQQIPLGSIQDSVIGWMKVYKFTGARAPMTIDAKHYSPAQMSIADSLANWIQASYLPKGALGDVIRRVSPKLGLYNPNDAALPQTYGAYAKTYTELKRNANGRLAPFTNSHETWSIEANEVFGEPLQILNTPTQYYFLLPNLASKALAVNTDLARYDLSRHPAVTRYFTYFNDPRKSMTTSATYVVLSPDNKLPFVTITKAEYLDAFAGAIDRKHVAERDEAIRNWPDGKARLEMLLAADDRYQKRTALLASNRQQYSRRLQEPAAVFSIQPGLFLENDKDVFEGNGSPGERYAVYKVDPAMNELARTDKPQWLVVWWNGDLLNPVGKQQIDAIVNNFDFQYVHDFFFDPEKVRGRPYKPLHPPLTR